MMTTGQRIKAKRLEHDMSQQELADRVGLKSKAAISLLENDKRGIDKDLLLRLAQVFDCSVDELTDGKRRGLTVQFRREDMEKFAEKIRGTEQIRRLIDNYLESISSITDEDLILNEYLTDPEIRRLVLFAGAKLPQGEARRKYVDAMIYASEMLTKAGLQ